MTESEAEIAEIIAKLRNPAWTEETGQRLLLDPTQTIADMERAAELIEKLQERLALNDR